MEFTLRVLAGVDWAAVATLLAVVAALAIAAHDHWRGRVDAENQAHTLAKLLLPDVERAEELLSEVVARMKSGLIPKSKDPISVLVSALGGLPMQYAVESVRSIEPAHVGLVIDRLAVFGRSRAATLAECFSALSRVSKEASNFQRVSSLPRARQELAAAAYRRLAGEIEVAYEQTRAAKNELRKVSSDWYQAEEKRPGFFSRKTAAPVK